jgi:hypothetical protein
MSFEIDRDDFACRREFEIPRVQQFQNLADTMVPGWFEWHPWTMRAIKALCHRRYVGLSGCSGSCKTHNVTGFAVTWWLANPEESSVILCSTTMKSLRKRAWSELQSYENALHETNGGPFGNLVNSQTVWQFKQGDDLHAIFGMAVQEGNIDKTAANIQGIHTKRQMVVIDEAEAVPTAIWKACANLYSYPIDAGGEFILVALANARSRLSQFGRFIEPENGWDSVSVDTDEWESKPQLDGKAALVLRFDFRKSPNVIENRMVSRHLPTKSRVTTRLKALKDRGAENDPDHWAFDLGFPPPEGLSKTVFTETMLIKHKCYDRHQFTGENFRITGGFDPAYGGGDRPALRFAAYGEIGVGKMGIELMDPILLFTDATSTDPIRYQLVYQIKKHCANVSYRGQLYTCQPEDFGIDCSGDGGVGDIAQQEWSPKIIRIQFGASPSDEPCSHEDQRSAKDVYKNKRVEMYFRTRNAAMAGQLRGVDKDTAEELCTLEYDDSKPKVVMQEKRDYKLKFTKSPDLADSAVMITEVCRTKGFRVIETGHTVDRDVEIEKLVASSQAVYEDINYSADNECLEPSELFE